MTEKQKVAAERIYDVLTKQAFADFYGYVEMGDAAPFSRHIESDENSLTKDEILKEIVSLFRL